MMKLVPRLVLTSYALLIILPLFSNANAVTPMLRHGGHGNQQELVSKTSFRDDTKALVDTQYDVVMTCSNILEDSNPCFGKGALRGSALTYLVRAMVFSIFEMVGPQELFQNELVSLRLELMQSIPRPCDDPSFCAVGFGRAQIVSHSHGMNKNVADSLFPVIQQVKPLQTLLQEHGYSVLASQAACIEDSVCTLSYTVYPQENEALAQMME